MRGHWWGLAVLGAAACLSISVAAAKTPPKSSPESVTIPLILRQGAPAKPEPEKPSKPKSDEPKSPQAILEEPTPVAMQSPVQLSLPSPELPPPEAPTLAPALPTNPELFVPELTLTPPAEPKPTPKPAAPKPPPPPVKLAPAEPTATAAQMPVTPPEPKSDEIKPGRRGVMDPIDDGPRKLPPAPVAPEPTVSPQPVAVFVPPPATPTPKAKPARPDPSKMKPVEEFAPGTLRAARDGKPPTFRCFVRDVMAFYDRTHVRCYNKVQGKVHYFAVDTNQPVAETVVTKALAAMKSGKPITIAFAPESTLNPSNCGKKDCRRLIDIEN